MAPRRGEGRFASLGCPPPLLPPPPLVLLHPPPPLMLSTRRCVGPCPAGGLMFGWPSLSGMLKELENFNANCPTDDTAGGPADWLWSIP